MTSGAGRSSFVSLPDAILSEIAVYAVPSPVEVACRRCKKVGSSSAQVAYTLLLKQYDPWLLMLMQKNGMAAAQISSSFRESLNYFGACPRRVWICVRRTEFFWKHELKASPKSWAGNWPGAIVLADVISRALMRYENIHTIFTAYAALLGKSIARWHLDLLEQLCDTTIRVPHTQAAANFLLEALSLIDSFHAYRTLLQSPLRQFLSDETAASLADDAELAFDLRRAGRPYH